MATSKKAKSNAVTTRASGGALATIMQQVAADRQSIAKAPQAGGQTLSFRGGTISYGSRTLGNEVDIVVMRSGFERVFYAGEFEADRIVAPNCFSYDGAAPHPDAQDPQAKSCAECPRNEWGSDRRGKGKACREGVKIALLLAPGNKPLTREWAESAPVITAKFSVLNSQRVTPKIDSLYERFGAPCKAVVTLEAHSDPNIQVANDLSFKSEIDDADVLDALGNRLAEAGDELVKPYPQGEIDTGAAKSKSSSKGRRQYR